MALKNLKVSINQINCITGDLEGNTAKIINAIEVDAKKEIDIIVFPETAISGYMCGALWDDTTFLSEQEDKLDKIRGAIWKTGFKGIVVIGYVEFGGLRYNGYPKIYNSVAIMNSKSINIYRKRILADADHHEDKKYFIAGKNTEVFEYDLPNVGKIRIGFPICEDMWYTQHERNIPGDMVKKYGADLIVNINQSYFSYGKHKKRYEMLKKFASSYDTPVIYINSTGVGDIVKNIVSFDGGSMIIDNKGQLKLELKRFGQAYWTGNPFGNLLGGEFDAFFSNYSKMKEITESLLYVQKEFFKLSGIYKAQVHVSGGLDSAIIAALVQKAMGKANTIFLTNPTDLNEKSLKYVDKLTDALGNQAWMQPLQKIYNRFMKFDTYTFGEELHNTGKATVQAVLRTVQGLAASHRFGSGIVATGNHTEIVLGWASFHDIGSIGVHALIGDLTKVELYQLAAYINDELYGKEIIPKDLYDGTFKPAAELPDATGEDPIDYWVQSGICAMLIRDRSSKAELMEVHNLALGTCYPFEDNYGDKFPKQEEITKYSEKEWEEQIDFALNKMRFSVYKAAQGAPIVIVSPRSRGFSNRETLINYYRR